MFEFPRLALVSGTFTQCREEEHNGVFNFADGRHLPFGVRAERDALPETLGHRPDDAPDARMPYHHRHDDGEGVFILSRRRQSVGQTTEVHKTARVRGYLPPRRLTVVVLVDVPQGIDTPIRTITHHITDIAHTAGDDAAAEVAAVVFAGFVDAPTPRRDEVGAGFHQRASFEAFEERSSAIVGVYEKLVKVSTNLDNYAKIRL